MVVWFRLNPIFAYGPAAPKVVEKWPKNNYLNVTKVEAKSLIHSVLYNLHQLFMIIVYYVNDDNQHCLNEIGSNKFGKI